MKYHAKKVSSSQISLSLFVRRAKSSFSKFQKWISRPTILLHSASAPPIRAHRLNDPTSQWATVSATCQHTDLKTSLWPTLAGRFIEELYCFIDVRGESIVSLRRDWSQFHLDRSIQGVFKVFPFHW